MATLEEQRRAPVELREGWQPWNRTHYVELRQPKWMATLEEQRTQSTLKWERCGLKLNRAHCRQFSSCQKINNWTHCRFVIVDLVHCRKRKITHSHNHMM